MFSMWIRSKVRHNCTEKVKKWGSADSWDIDSMGQMVSMLRKYETI